MKGSNSQLEIPLTEAGGSPAGANPREEITAALKLGLPAVGEQVLTMLVNLVNTMLVGHLGASALTAVGLAGTISFLSSTFFAAVATGATTLIAQAFGARNKVYAHKVLQQSLIIGLSLGIAATMVLFPLARQGMLLMGAEPEAAYLGTQYLQIVSLSLPFLSLLLVAGGALRGAGDTRSPMVIMGGMNIINLLLSITLVRGLGAIPALGVRGAGIAASFSTAAGSAAIMWLLLSGKGKLALHRPPPGPDRSVLAALLRIGLPAGGEQLLFRLAFMAYTRTIASLGTIAYAAYIVTQRLEGFFDMPALGFGIAATTLVGQALGAQKPEMARRAVFYCILVSLCFSVLFGILSWFWPLPLMRLFTSQPEVLEQGFNLMRIIALGMPTVAFALVFAGGLRGAGNTRYVMLITGIGSWVVRVPIAFHCITVLPWGLAGVQVTMFLDYGIRALLMGARYSRRGWQAETMGTLVETR